MTDIDFDTTPALWPPPPGANVNFTNPDNIHTLIRVTVALCLGVSSLLVLLRIWSRALVVKQVSWDDYIMVVAWLCFIAYSIIGLEAMNFGSGVHQYNVMLSDFFIFLKLANVLEVFYNPLIFLTKLSILLQYQRIFCPHRNGIFRLIWALIIFNLLFYIAVMIPQILACSPREKIWHPLIPGKCLDLASILIAGAVVNIISDFSILILPIYSVWQLQLNTARKIGVSSVFATGLFACLSSVLRLVNNVRFAHTSDITWDLTPVALWTFAEVASGIICGCLPAIPPLFRQYVPKIRSTLGSKNTKKTLSKTPNDSNMRRDDRFEQASYVELDEPNRPESRVGLKQHSAAEF